MITPGVGRGQSSALVAVRAATRVARRRASWAPRSPSARWIAITARASPSARARGTPGAPPAEPDGDDLRPLQPRHVHDVAHDEAVPLRRRVDPREQQQHVADRGRDQEHPEPVVPVPRDRSVAGREHREPEEHDGLREREPDRHPPRPDRPEPLLAAQILHAWMLVTRIARAPSAYSSSMTWFVRLRGTIARTATQPGSCSGEIVGDSRPGVTTV